MSSIEFTPPAVALVIFIIFSYLVLEVVELIDNLNFNVLLDEEEW